jgi:hypothetical protein
MAFWDEVVQSADLSEERATPIVWSDLHSHYHENLRRDKLSVLTGSQSPGLEPRPKNFKNPRYLHVSTSPRSCYIFESSS